MNSAYLSALSALGGSLVGGLISIATTWLTQRYQADAGRRAHDQAQLEDLYKDFIIAASTNYLSALTSNDANLPEIVQLYAIINRLRIEAPGDIVSCADTIMRVTADLRFGPNKTVSELHDMMKSGGGPGLDLLRSFSDMARRDRETP
jgi:hypothetical protein